jgi:hypothetical protein
MGKIMSSVVTTVGLGFKLADTLASWILSPDGYRRWSADRTREKVKRDAIKAFHAGDIDALNAALVELKRL